MIGAEPNEKEDVEIGMSVWKELYSIDIIKGNNIKFPSERKYISEDIIFHLDYLKKAKHVVIENTANYYCDNSDSLTKKYKKIGLRWKNSYLRKKKVTCHIYFHDIFIRKGCLNLFLGRVRRYVTQEVIANDVFDAIYNIKVICHDSLVQEILKKYDFHKNNMSQKFFNLFYSISVVFYYIF